MAQHIKDYSTSNICKVKAIANCRLTANKMDNHDRQLKIEEVKKYLKEEYHHILAKIRDSELHSLWRALNGKTAE